MTNRLARYIGNGNVEIVSELVPALPPGGLLVRTEACGLCSGELMRWYMDRKLPHVLGHEVAGIVEVSEDDRFPVGSRVFPHHHAPCLRCALCLEGKFVHCPQWKSTKLVPGGMAERFVVAPENLTDTVRCDDLRPQDAALLEPLGCVMKAIRLAGSRDRAAVVGLGFMGLLHMFALDDPVGYDLNAGRVDWAQGKGLRVGDAAKPEMVETVFVCPGSQAAFDFALSMVNPGGMIVMFAPLAPGEDLRIPQAAYFRDITIRNAYSAGPNDTQDALELIRAGKLSADQVVSHFIGLDELPKAYQQMKAGEILKPMVLIP